LKVLSKIQGNIARYRKINNTGRGWGCGRGCEGVCVSVWTSLWNWSLHVPSWPILHF